MPLTVSQARILAALRSTRTALARKTGVAPNALADETALHALCKLEAHDPSYQVQARKILSAFDPASLTLITRLNQQLREESDHHPQP